MNKDTHGLQEFCELAANVVYDMRQFSQTMNQMNQLNATVAVIREIAPEWFELRPILEECKKGDFKPL